MPIRLLLVDDDPMVRRGLRYVLQSAEDVEIVGDAGDGQEALDVARTRTMDVVLMDLRMPGMDGLEATRKLRARPSPPHILVLTTWDVDDVVIHALEAGASGFLLKTADPSEILSAIRSVMNGDAVLSPRSTRHLLNHLARDVATDQRRQAERMVGTLTDRERDVTVAVGRGLTNKQIGAELFMAEATAKDHIAAIQTKLGVPNRVRIAVMAERAGLLRSV